MRTQFPPATPGAESGGRIGSGETGFMGVAVRSESSGSVWDVEGAEA
jgi:hypothetical protein